MYKTDLIETEWQYMQKVLNVQELTAANIRIYQKRTLYL